MPRYPDVHVRLRTRHPLALVSAVRQALRRRGVERREIHRFSEQAMRGERAPREVCESWADVEIAI